MKKVNVLIFTIFSSTILCGFVVFNPDKNTVPKNINDYINAHKNNNRFSGNLIISKADTTLYKNSFGYADFESKTPITDSTIFLIGSITKPFTAYAIMLLENEGLLNLEDPLSKFFPRFPESDKVSILQLLNHTSGITDYHFFEDWKEVGKSPTSPKETIERITKDPFRFEPGERFRYSNTGYIMLGPIIEKVSGTSFKNFIEAEICLPFNLKKTGVLEDGNSVNNLAKGYSTSPKKRNLAESLSLSQAFSSGNMYSTTSDLIRFFKSVLNSKLLPKPKTDLLFKDEKEIYELGWGLRNFEGIYGIGHHGEYNGFTGSLTFLPEKEIFICFLTNDENTPKYSITINLVKIHNNKDYVIPEVENYFPNAYKRNKEITGKYLVKSGDTLNVYFEKKQLKIKESGQIPFEIFPLDNGKYVSIYHEFKFSFSGLNNGIYDSLLLETTTPIIAPRILI